MTTVSLPHLSSGKVRDIYDAGDDRLLMVTSDRLSAFDVVMSEPIPDKGRVLTAMSAFWFDRLADVIPGHLVSTDLADVPVDDLRSAVRDFERQQIRRVLQSCADDKREAARRLGLGLSSLYRKLEELGLRDA